MSQHCIHSNNNNIMISVGGSTPPTAAAYGQQQQSQHEQYDHSHTMKQEPEQEQAASATASNSHHHKNTTNTTTTTTTTTGRKGDPRMHRAVAARFADPSLTLFQALVMGGFDYTVDDYTDSSCMDSDHVALAQRKNQLSRRLRLAKRHVITPSATIQGKAVLAAAAAATARSSLSAAAAGHHYNHSTTTTADIMSKTATADSLTASLDTPDSSSITPQQPPQNQGLAEMLRQQRESFRLLQQQQQSQQQQHAAGTISTNTAPVSTDTTAPVTTTNNTGSMSAAPWLSWDNELQDRSKERRTSCSSAGCSPSSNTNAAAPPPSKAKDHPDFHPIIVSRVGGNGSACNNSSSSEMTNNGNGNNNPIMTATAIVPGTSSVSNSSNSSYHHHAGSNQHAAAAPPIGNMTAGTMAHHMLLGPLQQQSLLNGATPLSTTMAAAAASTEQALVLAAAQEQQQQAAHAAFLNSTTANATKMHPSGLALHSISKTAQSLGMTLELFALALASADTQRLTEALFPSPPPPPAPATSAASQEQCAAAAAASEELPAQSTRKALQENGIRDNKNDGNKNNSDPATTASSSLQQLPLSPLRTIQDCPLTRQEELALQLHMHEAKTLYSKCMLLVGFSSEEAAQDNPMAVRFALEAWEREGQRLQQLLNTKHAEQQQDAQEANNNRNSTNQNDQQQQQRPPSNNTTSESTISSYKRKRVSSTDSSNKTCTKINANGSIAKQQEFAEGQCTYRPGLHVHRLEGKCGHKAIVHNPRGGPAHIDFVVGTKVECYHQHRPLQATTMIMPEDEVRDDNGVCTTDADSTAVGNCEDPPSTTPFLPQNTTIWPSQFKCQDLSCSIACSKLKPMADEQNLLARTSKSNGLYVKGSGDSFDGTQPADEMTTSDQQQESAADAAATLVNNYFNMNPRIFDLNELDLESGEWNWDLNDVGFLGLFKLGDTAPAAASTTEPPPTTPASNLCATAGTSGSGKRVKQLEILQEHLHHQQEDEEEEPTRKKKKKKQK